MRIFWQESVTFMKFLPKAVKSELRLVRFLKKKLNVAKKSLHVVTFTQRAWFLPKLKHVKCKTCRGTWKFSCITQAIYLTCKHLARYMEISMYLAMCFIARYMEISMYLNLMKHMERYMEISMYLATKDIAGYMEISMYLASKDMVGYMEISIPCHVSLQGTWKFPCTLSVVLGESTRKFPCTSVSVLPKETWKIPYICILVEKYIEEIHWARITVKYPFNIAFFMTVYTADWQTYP